MDDENSGQEYQKQLKKWGESLEETSHRMQSEFDKAVLALSGGALGISMTFLKDIVLARGIHDGEALWLAWCFWGASVTCTLISFYTSAAAFRKAIKQLRAGRHHEESPGGSFDCFTKVLNFLAGGFFVAGVVSIVIFAATNLP